ncbi:MAG: elongation factor P [Bacteroidetes bacterium]|nr:elongation factor P [Bacteroidota bacterium]HET6243783.1 elongation factor P [Bacteroidia bacterium]
MATTSDISKGSFLRYNNELLIVLDYDHITPGKGNAIYSVKCRNVETGKQSELRFRSGEKVDFIRVEAIEMQYLYQEGDSLVCMNQENFEQLSIPKILFGDAIAFLQEGMILIIRFDENDKPVQGSLPKYTELEVIYTEDSRGKLLKMAEVEGGIQIQVPIFINIGDKLKINIDTSEYVERIK